MDEEQKQENKEQQNTKEAAEENKKEKIDEKAQESKPEKTQEEKDREAEKKVLRILSKDIEGGMTLYSGLTKIKGISWSMSNAICKKLGLDKKRKIGTLTEEEIKKITDFVKENPDIPKHLKNRRKDFETGENTHLIGSDLELKQEFDVKRLKNIKSYRGYRHVAGLPTRGQRTRSNFRKNRSKGAGIKKKR
ncbi:30S ribosomal protein S13 [Candidatus Pacearchaeota archaeon]|nr:30S ribosomal protein S13 [Candidatus Pacearchaeota archaeon]